MKIAIIGGGFFGFHIEREILRKDRQSTVHVYEQNSATLTEAANKNQCRPNQSGHHILIC
jgi:predicted dehydrogenase